MRPTMRVACNFLSFVKARRAELACLSLFLFLCTGTPTGEQVVRFLRFDDVAETLELFVEAGLSAADIKDSTAWNDWVRTRDAEVRARVDQGVEDSISNLILYGASYRSLPRLAGVVSAA